MHVTRDTTSYYVTGDLQGCYYLLGRCLCERMFVDVVIDDVATHSPRTIIY